MKKNFIYYAILLCAITSCKGIDNSILENNVHLNNVTERKLNATEKKEISDFRKPMRDFVIGIAEYARKTNSKFIVIPQNGQAVAWDPDYDENPTSSKNTFDKNYFSAINGTGREDTFYGAGEEDYTLSPEYDSKLFIKWCDIYKKQKGADGKNITVLSTDYCESKNSNDSSKKNSKKGYISFPAPERDLNKIPNTKPYNENSNNIKYLSDAKNFLYILNYEKYSSKEKLLKAIKNTNYDLIIMDAYDNDGNLFSKSDIKSLKTKANGGKRLVISYMSIGEAEDYRWYFNNSWVNDGKPKSNAPSWLDKENPDWQGNYKVRYWDKNWQDIIYGNDKSYTKKILNAGFDGVYLDIIDAYEYYEE